MLITLSPVFTIISLIILRKEGSPIFEREKCHGKDHKSFIMYTFRTMSNPSSVIKSFPNNELPTNRIKCLSSMNHHRILTVTGLKIRKLQLHKLPLLFNVLKGDMSIVGPLPFHDNEVISVGEKEIIKLKPGMIGYAQLESKGSNYNREDDLYYSRNPSHLMDAKVFIRVIIRQLFNRKDKKKMDNVLFENRRKGIKNIHQ